MVSGSTSAWIYRTTHGQVFKSSSLYVYLIYIHTNHSSLSYLRLLLLFPLFDFLIFFLCSFSNVLCIGGFLAIEGKTIDFWVVLYSTCQMGILAWPSLEVAFTLVFMLQESFHLSFAIVVFSFLVFCCYM